MKINTNRGFVKMVIIIILAIVILSYFGFNLRDIFTSELVQDNLSYVWGFVVKVWDLFIQYIWTPLLSFFN